MNRYYVISPIDSEEELAILPTQFNRRFVRLKKDDKFYFLDSKIDQRELDEFFEAYPKKKARSLIFSRSIEAPNLKSQS